MNMNGIGPVTSGYSGMDAEKAVKTEAVKNEPVKQEQTEAAVYEKSSEAKSTTGHRDTAVINKLKADAEARTASLRSLVEKMMLKQGQTVTSATDYLMALKNGTLQVDDATRAQAQKDIAEDGYWGVEQTSERLVSFAKALAGNDSAKADELMKAIEKGFGQATKSWGDDLPDICQRTLAATREKMEAWKNGTEAKQEPKTEDATAPEK